MFFHFNNTKKLSIIIAFLISFISFILGISFYYILNIEANWVHSFITSTIIFFITWLLLRLILEHFIYDRIRLIYKSIRSTKQGKNKNKKIFSDGDIIENVNRDVEEWAVARNTEIEKLKEMESYRREYIGNVSHELKTPITTIQGYVLTLLDGGIEDKNINKKYLLRAAKNINRLTAIINDLEEISRIETGMLQMKIAPLNFSILIKDVFDFMEIKAQKRGIRLIYSIDFDKAIWVIADQNRIRQVIINLIDNSLKYGEKGGETTISTFDMDDNFLIEITDNGIGLTQEELPRIFERFYRTDKSRSRDMGGTGLGLSIVKHIIEAHEQSINARSKLGIGTTFAFTLKKAKGK